MENKKKDLLTYVSLLASSQAFLETYDDLKHTKLYKQKLRNISNKFVNEVVKELEQQVIEMFDSQEEVSQELIGAYHRIAKVVGTISPMDVVMIADQLEGYQESLKNETKEK